MPGGGSEVGGQATANTGVGGTTVGTDALFDIEDIIGSDFDDILTGEEIDALTQYVRAMSNQEHDLALAATGEPLWRFLGEHVR